MWTILDTTYFTTQLKLVSGRIYTCKILETVRKISKDKKQVSGLIHVEVGNRINFVDSNLTVVFRVGDYFFAYATDNS